MKRLLTLVLITASLNAVQAQEGSRISIKGAYNSTWLFNKNISDKNQTLDYASSFGGSFGFQYLYQFSEKIGVSGELLFSSQNQKYDGDFGGNVTITAEDKLSYIDIPLLVRFGSGQGVYFEIGPQFSFLSGAKESFGTSPGSPDDYTDKDFKDDFKSSGVAAVLGFGIDIQLNDNWSLTPGLRFGYQFTDATTEYSLAEASQLDDNGKLSFNAMANHTTGSTLKVDPTKAYPFGYEASNRAFGGLHVSLNYHF